MLSNAIIKTVAYFDVFGYPLSGEQIFQFLPRNSVTPEEVSATLKNLVTAGVLDEDNKYYFLRSRSKGIVPERNDNELRARRLMKYARMVSLLLKQFPFTRAVFVTGSLSKNVATSESDIDLMIVTAPGRLWICKTTLTLFRKTFLLGSNKYFCTNFYVSENALAIPERNMFSAIELVTTKVIWNTAAYDAFQRANIWSNEYLPNWKPSVDTSVLVRESRSWFQRIVETVTGFFPLNALDLYLMNVHKRQWTKRYKYLDEEKRALLFRTSPDVSSVWKNDHQTRVMNTYSSKLRELGLSDQRD